MIYSKNFFWEGVTTALNSGKTFDQIQMYLFRQRIP